MRVEVEKHYWLTDKEVERLKAKFTCRELCEFVGLSVKSVSYIHDIIHKRRPISDKYVKQFKRALKK